MPILMTTFLSCVRLVASAASVVFLALLLAPDEQSSKLLDRGSLCKQSMVVIYLQKQQFRRAQEDISSIEDCAKLNRKNSDNCKPTKDEIHKKSFDLFRKGVEASRYRTDGLFYSHSYGGMDVEDMLCKAAASASAHALSRDAPNCRRLGYYNIWKNGNEYIHSLLYRYSHNYTLPQKLMTKPSCKLGFCAQYGAEHLKEISFPKDQKRFPFTFTRDPISRFISAYNEIEFRFSDNVESRKLPLVSPLGSKERVKEFIMFVVASGGSKEYFVKRYDVDIMHIMPQIGTVLLANNKEETPIHLYRLENFETEIERLAEESGFIDLIEIYKTTPKNIHDSVQYAPVTSAPAKALLLDPSSVSDLRYIRALCRMYLIDYFCLNYTIPPECSTVEEEALQLLRAPLRRKQSDNVHVTHLLCRNEWAIERLQTEMFRLARDELLVDTDICDSNKALSNISASNGDDMGFYQHNYGLTMIERREDLDGNKKNSSNTLVYYRIWKNANDNIRRIMFHYSSLSDFTVEAGPCDAADISCISSMHSRHPRYDPSSGSFLKLFFQSKKLLDTFPFTFVRNPIDRFISAYTEIEFRLNDRYKAHWLPLHSPLGTIERLKEFIRFLIASNGSRKVLMEQNAEIPHCAPQIGTILMARSIEPKDIRLYKFENFGTEWIRLASESGFLSLKDAYRPQFQGHHKSSSDPFNTTYISKLYFEEYLNPNSSSTFDSRKVSAIYLRALCRIYLVDFICGDYSLPPVCADLYAEVDDAISQLNEKAKQPSLWNRFSLNFIRQRIPQPLLHFIASFYCVLDRSPSCEAAIVYGEVFDEEDDDI